LDIEAAISNGALSVGIFGFEDMLNIDQAEEMMRRLSTLLEDACGDMLD
jgi:hypothetical protein